MKRAVSISIGSSKRNKSVELQLLGETVVVERIGTDGDMEKAAEMYRELDGKVDAFGVGGADLGMMVADRYYPFYSALSLVRYVKQTPVADGTGIKNTLENRAAPFVDAQLGGYVTALGKKAFIATGTDRWGLGQSFLNAGYECVYGDLMFILGLSFPIRTARGLKILAASLAPVVARLPFKWLYPTGEKQEERKPKFIQYYQWATVVGGDCHYIKRHMPERMDGKVIVTNTTTADDVALFRASGVKYLVTTTPVFEGRSFGTNMIEAALIAVSGKGRKLTDAELNTLLDQLKFEPQLQALN